MTRSLVLSLVSLLSLDALRSTAHADRVGPQAGARAPMPSRIEQEPMDPPVQPTPIARPAPETAATGKALAGTWQCKGVTLAADGSSTPIVSTVTTRLDVGNAWIQSTQAGLVEYRTFDGVAKLWTRVQLLATSGLGMATSTGEQAGTTTWTGTEQSSTGTLQIRDHEVVTATSIRSWGEALLGGTWQKRYELTCTK